MLLLSELIYLKLAYRFGIFDLPNERSSHGNATLRGGGIIFYLGIISYFLYSGLQYPWFFTGLSLIVAISFLDDVQGVRNLYRFAVHTISVGMMFLDLNLYPETWLFIIFAGTLTIGTINAFNFMDGINGITGGYSLVILAGLAYVNNQQITFVANDLILFSMISVVVFNLFNFRIKAHCFAGDVGSISIAFILTFLLASLIIATQNLVYILFLSVYGIDSVFTILHRLHNKENIFGAHRSHLYQVLANEGHLTHILISIGYMVVQLLICLLVILISALEVMYQLILSMCVLTALAIAYETIKGLYKELIKDPKPEY
ncbi:MAG: glycosyltransferase family 4 protein [Balneolales bacterium]